MQKNETILEKFQNNKCEIVNPQRFVVCEQTLPAENGKTHFMGKNAKQSKKYQKIFLFQFDLTQTVS